jgi:hypothetical protein
MPNLIAVGLFIIYKNETKCNEIKIEKTGLLKGLKGISTLAFNRIHEEQ